ncbi:MAG: hypothetical protein Q4C91_11125 [Eubacteriales bacterium]|nr:hypothetical protein [Eubacteriales bacterium]
MLLLKESKKVFFSIVFVVYFAAMVLMAVSQDSMDFSGQKITEPQQGENYGTKAEEIPEVIMPAALEALYNDFLNNSYIAYPIGFYKEVKLNDSKQKAMAGVLEKITGISAQELMREAKSVQDTEKETGTGGEAAGSNGIRIDAEDMVIQEDGSYAYTLPDENVNAGEQTDEASADALSVSVKENLTYAEFKMAMNKADEIIGGGSSYRTDNLAHFSMVPVTYEEALEQYRLTKEKDRFTGGYARLFSDYMVVSIISILPVFLAVALCLKDRQSGMEQIIYTRCIPAWKLIGARYLAVLSAVMLPEILLAYVSNASVWGLYPGESLDYLAPLKYAVIWLLPTAMISAAVGMFFTELTKTPVAIAIQGLWWMYDINQGIWEENGCSLFRLAPRHNTIVRTQDWFEHMDKFAANRIFFTCLALALLAATIYVYEQKRRGRLHGKDKKKRNFRGLGNRTYKYQA